MGMLNYETLLSSYDDKLTLMQWLKKVEEALKDASAVSFNVNKRGDATLTFSIVFEDGSEIESDPITLQQGESVQSAYIQNGHLHLVLTNGDDLDAGNMFNGNVTINGNFEVTGRAKLPNIEGDGNNNINVDGNIIVADGGISVADGAVSTPILTSQNEEIEAQKPVVEVMNGYSAALMNNENWNIVPVYVGAVKNGNKLTIAVAVKATKTDASAVNYPYLVSVTIPSEIHNKIFPFSGVMVDYKECVAVASPSQNCRQYCEKVGDNKLQFGISQANNFVVGTEYYIRHEVTFLLSSSLIE